MRTTGGKGREGIVNYHKPDLRRKTRGAQSFVMDGQTGRPFIHLKGYLSSRYDVCEGGRCYIRSEGCNSILLTGADDCLIL